MHDDLTASEKEAAQAIAEEISISPVSRDKEPSHQYPEAEAMVLMGRTDLETMELLVDEPAVREVARRQGIAIVGFPGILIRACKPGLMTQKKFEMHYRSVNDRGLITRSSSSRNSTIVLGGRFWHEQAICTP